MSDGQLIGVFAIIVGALILYLESRCALQDTLKAIYNTPNFGLWLVAIFVFLILLTVVGEPYSTWLAGLVILVLLYNDVARNDSFASQVNGVPINTSVGNTDIFHTLGLA